MHFLLSQFKSLTPNTFLPPQLHYSLPPSQYNFKGSDLVAVLMMTQRLLRAFIQLVSGSEAAHITNIDSTCPSVYCQTGSIDIIHYYGDNKQTYSEIILIIPLIFSQFSWSKNILKHQLKSEHSMGHYSFFPAKITKVHSGAFSHPSKR